MALHGLKAEATYVVEYESTGEGKLLEGAELMAGLQIEIPQRHRSDLITYRMKL